MYSRKERAKRALFSKTNNLCLQRFSIVGADYMNLEMASLSYRGERKVNEDYIDCDEDEIEIAAKRVFNKLNIVNSEKLKWFEVLLAMVFAVIAYNMPVLILIFQAKMRQLEMEDEVMQFQTIILMLMRIERVNVEIILEWLERYANIFKDPISKCVNNYESGAWEALEAMKLAQTKI